MTLTDIIFKAGILGCGGAGFPTHAKLSANVEHLLLNGAECEPLLRTDRYIMLHKADQVIMAASAIRKFLGNIPCTIALKAAYKEEIAALNTAIKQIDDQINIYPMQSFYPAGDEQVIVAEVMAKPVPPAGIPLDIGCVVSNIATMLCVAEAIESHTPFTQKYLTVTGMVKKPTVIKVAVGTSFEECIELAGGAINQDYIVVSGGPMMGQYMTKQEALSSFISKTTSGIIVLPKDSKIARSAIPLDQMQNRAKSACIQCNYCTQFCPRYLLGHPLKPHRIMSRVAMAADIESVLDNPDIQKALLCCECGICELFACPMDLQPRRINALIKQKLGKLQIRYPKGEGGQDISAHRAERLVPTKRAAARAGVLEYYDACNTDNLIEYMPKHVSLALNMNIGAPGKPIVANNDYVEAGQLIAICPDGKLGANLHASLSGYVKVFDDRITIASEEAKEQ